MTHATSLITSDPLYSMLLKIWKKTSQQNNKSIKNQSLMLQRITGRCLTSVVMTRQEAVGLIVTSPVIRPTSWNSSYISLYFWLLKALMGLVKMTRCFSLSARAMAYLRAEGNALRSKAVFLNRWVSRPFWECSQRNDNKSSQKFFWCKPLFSNVCVKAVDPFAKTLLLSDRTLCKHAKWMCPTVSCLLQHLTHDTMF